MSPVGSQDLRPLFGMAGKRILIIGGGQGMGEASARLLASLGCDLALLDIEPERAERVATDLKDMGVSAYAVAADVLQEDQLVEAIARTEREFGPLDGMATIVGMAGWSLLVDMSADMWDRDINRNLRYFFIAGREVAKSLIARNAPGTMVCVASVDGVRAARHHGAYGAAKAGLINLVKTMSQEWADHGIRVNCVAPGGIVTPRIPLGDPAKEREGMAYVPMRRRGTTDDIAKAVAFFLSDMSPYVTGQTLAVDGGYLAAGGFSATSPVPSGGTIGMKE